MMEMSNFENQRWRTAAILKIVITPYLSRESSEFDEIWYANANFKQGKGNVTKIQKFPNSRWRTDAILKLIFSAITRLCIVLLRQNLEGGCTIACTQRLDDENVKFRKSNMADGRHFENHYISISQPQLVRISRNLGRNRFAKPNWNRFGIFRFSTICLSNPNPVSWNLTNRFREGLL